MGLRPSQHQRQRCSECRRWYAPFPSAHVHQKTCGKGCRLRRRAEQERVRRAEDPARARSQERERQRAHRGRSDGSAGRMSRAGLPMELVDLIERIRRDWGQELTVSLAGLSRDLRAWYVDKARLAAVGTGTGGGGVTGRPHAATLGNDEGIAGDPGTVSRDGLVNGPPIVPT
jgi:hypothetical protein